MFPSPRINEVLPPVASAVVTSTTVAPTVGHGTSSLRATARPYSPVRRPVASGRMIATGNFFHIQPSTYRPASSPLKHAWMVPIGSINLFVGLAGVSDPAEPRPGRSHDPFAPGQLLTATRPVTGEVYAEAETALEDDAESAVVAPTANSTIASAAADSADTAPAADSADTVPAIDSVIAAIDADFTDIIATTSVAGIHRCVPDCPLHRHGDDSILSLFGSDSDSDSVEAPCYRYPTAVFMAGGEEELPVDAFTTPLPATATATEIEAHRAALEEQRKKELAERQKFRLEQDEVRAVSHYRQQRNRRRMERARANDFPSARLNFDDPDGEIRVARIQNPDIPEGSRAAADRAARGAPPPPPPPPPEVPRAEVDANGLPLHSSPADNVAAAQAVLARIPETGDGAILVQHAKALVAKALEQQHAAADSQGRLYSRTSASRAASSDAANRAIVNANNGPPPAPRAAHSSNNRVEPRPARVMVAANGQPVDARTHIVNDQEWRARNRLNDRHADEAPRQSAFTRIGPACFGPMIRGEPYPVGFKGPRDIEKYDTHIDPTSGSTQMASPINFNQFLEKEKLKSNGSNFTDWFRHVRIFLSGGNLQFVLDAPLGDPPAEDETDEVKAVYATRKTRYSQVQCAILCSLESDLQKRFEHHDPHELMNELKAIFETHAAVECYEASKHFFSCMMEEGSSVSEHMLAMTGHAKKLSDLGIVIPNRLGINRVLQSLPPSYKNFVMNYNMQNMNKELPELFGMLKAAEIEIKKEHQVLMVNKTTSFKKQGKSKGKFKKGGKKAATPPMKPKNGPKPDAECYYCKEKGHWKRNCSKYLADLKSGLVKKKKEGISDIHVIDVHFTGSRSSTWVFDTGSVAHICNSKQELKNKRQLLKDEVTMRVGNGSKVNVIAVGTLPLHLPSGLVLSLNNCYYVPALSMNIISGSCLMQDGYSFKSENNGCSIFMNNIFYGRAPQKNGLFLLDLDSSDTHIHNIDAKRIKLNDNSTYMWHCRLGHIGVKRMKKLHTDGLLESLDFESLDRCEACLMGKMTKTPFSGMMERATDLLEIIHTDVCGPMSVASRGGYRYVLTFTDDLSRYGYIYFMKHKSETFEKFKEFQSEVENQRNKKIKFLRSDRGGEYLSYEFGMHLKKCGILSQLTPPGTPQRNGVSERRNRTLLDMVRSMMSLTDLPLSFWSYALETAAFTLNRAPSKSVETTPYELWFNKKPKLSFLKVWGCEAYVKKLQPDKLEPKAEKCIFIGYPKETIGYTFYHRSEGKIFVAKNGTFLEKEFLTKEVTGRKVELDEIDESILVDQSSAVPEVVPVPPTPATEEANDNDHETSNEETTEPRRSTRERATPDWYDPCLNVMIVDNNDEDPATYEEAMMSPDSNKWQEAMKSEMGSMYDNKVWTLVDLPDSRKAVENKWIFKRKTDAD
ncbi:hypothetical protein QYE76_039218, partial [Lolium multiflorum]